MNAVEIALAVIAKHKEEAEAARAAQEAKKEQAYVMTLRLPQRLVEALREVALEHDLRTVQGPAIGELSISQAAVFLIQQALEPKQPKQRNKREPKDYTGERHHDRICLARVDDKSLLVQCLVCSAINTLSETRFLNYGCKTCMHRTRAKSKAKSKETVEA